MAAVVLTSLLSLSKYSAADKAIRSLLKLITTLKRESRERESGVYTGAPPVSTPAAGTPSATAATSHFSTHFSSKAREMRIERTEIRGCRDKRGWRWCHSPLFLSLQGAILLSFPFESADLVRKNALVKFHRVQN